MCRCFCGSDLFKISISGGHKNWVELTCIGCSCIRRVKTPGVDCSYSIEPRLEGFFITQSGRMTRDTPSTTKMDRRKMDTDDWDDLREIVRGDIE